MKSVKAKCKKCANTIQIDVGTFSREEVLARLASGTFSCSAGKHVELEPPAKYLEIDWNTLAERKDPMSDLEFGQKLIAENGKDNVFCLGDAEVCQALGISYLNGFPGLKHLGFGDFGNDEWVFMRHDSPRGFRFYVRRQRN